MIEELETLLLYANHERTSCSDDNPVNWEPHQKQNSTSDGTTFWGVRCTRCALLKALSDPYGDELDTDIEVRARWKRPCDHQWIDMRNEIIQSGEMCIICQKIRPGNG